MLSWMMGFTVWKADSFFFAEQSKQKQHEHLQTYTANEMLSAFYEMSCELQKVNLL